MIYYLEHALEEQKENNLDAPLFRQFPANPYRDKTDREKCERLIDEMKENGIFSFYIGGNHFGLIDFLSYVQWYCGTGNVKIQLRDENDENLMWVIFA